MRKKVKCTNKKKSFELRDLLTGMSVALSFAIVIGNALTFAVLKFNDFAHLEKNVSEIKAYVKEFRDDIGQDVNEIRSDIVGIKEDVAQIKGSIESKRR